MSCLQRKIRCNGKYQELTLLVHNLRPLYENKACLITNKNLKSVEVFPGVGASIVLTRAISHSNCRFQMWEQKNFYF